MSDAPLASPSDVPSRTLGVRIRRVDGDLVLAVQDQALLLTDSAKLIYTSLDGRRSVADVADVLAAEYGIEKEDAVADVAEFLTDLRAKDIVTW